MNYASCWSPVDPTASLLRTRHAGRQLDLGKIWNASLVHNKPVDVQEPRLLHSRAVRINYVLRQVGRQLRSLSDVDGEMMQNTACF